MILRGFCLVTVWAYPLLTDPSLLEGHVDPALIFVCPPKKAACASRHHIIDDLWNRQQKSDKVRFMTDKGRIAESDKATLARVGLAVEEIYVPSNLQIYRTDAWPVPSYPELFLRKVDGELVEYQGYWSSKNIVEWIEASIRPPVETLVGLERNATALEIADSAFPNESKVHLLGGVSRAVRVAFEDFAVQEAHSARFAVIEGWSGGLCSLHRFRDSDGAGRWSMQRLRLPDATSTGEFLRRENIDLITEMTAQSAQKVGSEPKLVVLCPKEQLEALRSAFSTIAAYWRQFFIVVWMNTSDKEMNVRVKAFTDFPPYVPSPGMYLSPERTGMFVYPRRDFDYGAMKNWLMTVMNGRAPLEYRTQHDQTHDLDWPADRPRQVVGSKLRELIQHTSQDDRDLLVLLHTALDNEVVLLGKALVMQSGMRVAAVDWFYNDWPLDLHDRWSCLAYPCLKYMRRGQSDPTTFPEPLNSQSALRVARFTQHLGGT
ncbi:MAG: uncharacterized protein KVP18_002215 [Porospora cf. gigantea A]|uniref:uncharacterized protein n=1 Tax=Porospora cf. gigantea A TaxID=2853593 RepID=UPI003559A5E3|nr:MAG: hypothetical protein KVP18_002215 [Porospora cf. gigantea A]